MMSILAAMPREASMLDEKQIQTRRSMIELDSFLFLLTAMITRVLRPSPRHPSSSSRKINTEVRTPEVATSAQEDIWNYKNLYLSTKTCENAGGRESTPETPPQFCL